MDLCRPPGSQIEAGLDRVCDAVPSQGFERGTQGTSWYSWLRAGGPGVTSQRAGCRKVPWTPWHRALLQGAICVGTCGWQDGSGSQRVTEMSHNCQEQEGVMWGPSLSFHTCSPEGFLDGSTVKYLPAALEAQVQSLGRVDPLDK